MGKTKKKQMKRAAMDKEQNENQNTREDPKMEEMHQKKQQKIIQVIRRNQVYFSSSNVLTDTAVIVKGYMLN